MEKEISNVAAIKRYFNDVTMAELKELSPEDREELGTLARAELLKAEKAGAKA